MLTDKAPEAKDFQQMLSKAIMEIPLYTNEWTNYNPSDPGITILENLTAFSLLQQSSIGTITPEIKQKLLKILGFEGKKGRCSRVLLAACGVEKQVCLPQNQKFWLGSLQFETNRTIYLDNYKLIGIYGELNQQIVDFSFLSDREINTPAMVLGEKPMIGDSVVFTANKLPEPGEELIFYFSIVSRYNRNAFEDKSMNVFATMEWECYTEEGFQKMNVSDHTCCFLQSGEVRMRMPVPRAIVCQNYPKEGYVIRARLTYADYDVKPKLTNVNGFLFEAWQKESKSQCYTFSRYTDIRISGEIAEEGYLQVFCKEEKNTGYRKYEATSSNGEKGRYYEITQEDSGEFTIHFDKRKYGFAPGRLKNAVKVMAYSEELMRKFHIGEVGGYDNQVLELPEQNIVFESFSIIAKRITRQGEEFYDFVKPNHYEENSLTYLIQENEGKIMIEDAGDFIGAELYMGTCSTYQGTEGNIREGNHFSAWKLPENIRIVNPAPGTGGCYRESIQDVRKKFVEDINHSYAAVTALDYERIVKETPGLCIDKVKAVMDAKNNSVRVAVKPGTDEEFPRLSTAYRRCLEERLEQRRLLTTRVEISSPVYLPVNVNGIVYVKHQYDFQSNVIEKTIQKQIDYLNTDKNFGEVLRFDKVFKAIEDLEGVEYIYELSLYPHYSGLGSIVDGDIVPNDNCLCYPGKIELEVRHND